MKQPTIVIVLQGLCALLVGASIPMGAALAQWVSADAPPSKVAWAIIILSGIAGGGTKLSSFLSTDFADYKSDNPSGTGSTLSSETVTVQTKREPAGGAASPPEPNKP
jgi:hypothetical protein